MVVRSLKRKKAHRFHVPRKPRTMDQVVTAQKLPRAEAQKLLASMKKAAKSEDDPPIIFAWDDQMTALLLASVVAYGGPHPVPDAFAALPIAASTNDLRTALLQHVVNATGATEVSGVLLACTQVQALTACSFLRGMELEPWMASVLAAAALPRPVATILTPRPRSAAGQCDMIPMNCTLWT